VSPVIKSLSHTDSDSVSADAARAGLYQVQYTVDIAGQYVVSVLYGGDQVSGSPFDVVVNPVGEAGNVIILS